MAQYGISLNHARTLTGDRNSPTSIARGVRRPVLAAPVADTARELNYRDMGIAADPADHIAELLGLLKKETTPTSAASSAQGDAGMPAPRAALRESRRDREREDLGKATLGEFTAIVQAVIASTRRR
jgi:aspartyl-tRNA(Asn)/glutamyl-tRNA(Gln) amidotransferase subunit B